MDRRGAEGDVDRLVNVIGGAGKEPDPYMLGSGMTNSALLNLTKALSTELGADNVLVNRVTAGKRPRALSPTARTRARPRRTRRSQ